MLLGLGSSDEPWSQGTLVVEEHYLPRYLGKYEQLLLNGKYGVVSSQQVAYSCLWIRPRRGLVLVSLQLENMSFCEAAWQPGFPPSTVPRYSVVTTSSIVCSGPMPWDERRSLIQAACRGATDDLQNINPPQPGTAHHSVLSKCLHPAVKTLRSVSSEARQSLSTLRRGNMA